MNRREFLRAGALAGVAGTAGCANLPVMGGDPTLADLVLSADVARQPTSDHPGRVRVELSCSKRGSVSVSLGPTLMFSEPETEPDTLFLDPESAMRPTTYRGDNGCWRVVDERMTVRAICRNPDVSRGNPLTETYDLYTFAGESPCLPAGTHEFVEHVGRDCGSGAVELTLALRVGEDKSLAVVEDETGATGPP